jgi:predicted enzyme related to lactoylglutathione lyase
MGFEYTTAFVTLADEEGETLVNFYRQVLGQEPKLYIPNVYAEFHFGGLKLGIFNPKPDHQPEFRAKSSGGMSLCLEVVNLEETISHLTALGYSPSGNVAIASHGKEIYAYDPLGNRLILHQAWTKGKEHLPI